MIRIGVVGYGHWGPHLARNLATSPGAELAAVCDHSALRLAAARRAHPDVPCTTDASALLADPRIDAVMLATPVGAHFPLAMAALRAGKHVLVEKPMTGNTDEALALIGESERRRLVLMVDHTFVFSPAVRALRELVAAGTLGELSYYDSARLNTGLVRRDLNVLWDLAVHDLAILDHVVPLTPTGVIATGVAPVPGETERVAQLTVLYPAAFVAHVQASWLAPVKTRRILLGGSRALVAYDDLEPVEKLRVHDCEFAIPDGAEDLRYRLTAPWAPPLAPTEPLRAVVDHFVECIAGDGGRSPTAPLASGWCGCSRPPPGRSGRRAVRRARSGGCSGVIPFADLPKQHARLRGELEPAIADVLARGRVRAGSPRGGLRGDRSPRTAAPTTASASARARARCIWRCSPREWARATR